MKAERREIQDYLIHRVILRVHFTSVKRCVENRIENRIAKTVHISRASVTRYHYFYRYFYWPFLQLFQASRHGLPGSTTGQLIFTPLDFTPFFLTLIQRGGAYEASRAAEASDWPRRNQSETEWLWNLECPKLAHCNMMDCRWPCRFKICYTTFEIINVDYINKIKIMKDNFLKMKTFRPDLYGTSYLGLLNHFFS